MLLTHHVDLIDVREVRVARTRDDLALAPGEVPLGGGTWLYSEPQPGTTGLVDLTALGWEPLVVSAAGLEIAATCTIAELARFAAPVDWTAHTLFALCADALLASWKIQGVATVGGNICTALPAGPMTSLSTALDGVALVWTAAGDTVRLPVAELVTGPQTTALGPGDVLRAIELPAATLTSRVGMRRASLTYLGRSAVLVIARADVDGAFVVTVTAATPRPRQFAFPGIPTPAELAAVIDAGTSEPGDWYDDPHGSPDWRRALSLRFAEELRVELAGGAS